PAPGAAMTFSGPVAGAIANVPIPGTDGVYTHNLSGTVTFGIQGDGSLSNPYQGTITVAGSDTAVKTSGETPGLPPQQSSDLESTTAPLQSQGTQITANGAGSGFAFRFNGFVSGTQANVTGTLTVTLT